MLMQIHCVHICEVVVHVLMQIHCVHICEGSCMCSCKYTVYIFVRGHACAHANTLCTYL